MHHISRLIIAIPIAILVLVVYIKMAFPNQLAMATSASGSFYQKPLPTPKKLDKTSDFVSFDIIKPRTCEYKNKELVTKVYIQNNTISASLTQEDGIKRLLLLDDCLYIWQEGKFSGQQICGMNQYIKLFHTYSPLLSPNAMMSMVPGFESMGGSGSKDILSNIMSSCVDGIGDEHKFILPNDIQFEEISLQQAQKSMHE